MFRSFLLMTITPTFNIVGIIVCLALSLGFYTESADWLMIYYGCAPKEKKSKMPKEKIITAAWASYLIMAFGFAICLFCNSIEYYLITSYTQLAIVITFIVMHIVTFIWCTKAK